MELYEKIADIESREDLKKFISLLKKDLNMNTAKWGNITLEGYVAAMESWVDDMEGCFMSLNQPVPGQPSWKLSADILYASAKYE